MATHWVKEDYRSTKKKFESHRQCTWILPSGKRCSKKACGYFFCKEHFIAATHVESGLMSCEMGRML
jgi:hypothetical protein